MINIFGKPNLRYLQLPTNTIAVPYKLNMFGGNTANTAVQEQHWKFLASNISGLWVL